MLHHVEIYVSDLARSFEFWSWLFGELGYEKTAQWDQGFSFSEGGTYLTFVQTEAQYLDTPYHRKHVGLNHLAFAVRARADVDRFRTRLAARGVSLLYDDRYPFAGGEGYYAVFLEDPDRLKVEIVSQA